MRTRYALPAVLTLLLVPGIALAEGSGHEDPVAPVLLAIAGILFAAKLGSEVAERFGLPAVLGELGAGILLGNLVLLDPGWDLFGPLRVATPEMTWAVVLDILGRLGVIILLFEVGLESTIKGMFSVGASSILVAVLGVATPMALGYGVSALLIHEIPSELASRVPGNFGVHNVHLFIGAILCATSVGITARVFKDLGRLQLREARIILGAAVVDDVLGLVILAVISGSIQASMSGGALDLSAIVRLVALAVSFLGGAVLLGLYVVPRLMKQLARLRTAGMMLTSALLFAFLLAYAGNLVGLAPIVGAFAAGLILEDFHFKGFREEIHIEDLIRPVSNFLVPIFFVTMGLQVHLEVLTDIPVLGVAAGITAAAFIGKLVCGFGVLEKGLDRLSVSIGMVPRGEVGLIFAGVGRSIGIVDSATFSSVVVMVMVTTLMTPPLLKYSLARRERQLK